MAPLKIDHAAIKNLAELLNETGLTEIEIAEGDLRIRVTKNVTVNAYAGPMPSAPAPAANVTPVVVTPASLDKHPGAVKSPMVGTVYLQQEPSSPKFAPVGGTVKVGDTLCIIEAMKVMNPIKAEKAGKVSQVLIDDATPVEFGEVMFVIE